MVSEVSRLYYVLLQSSDILYRCTGLPDDLDSPSGMRTESLLRGLVDELDSRTLWDEYGIDDDITVCSTCSIGLSLL